MVELDLPKGLGVELDALYRRVGVGYPARGTTEFHDGLWDFPVLAKYRFPGVGFRPYVGGGWTYRKLNDLLREPASSSNGGVVAAGIRLAFGPIRISPEFRYTRWPAKDFQPEFRGRKNQFEFLVGLTF